MELKEYQKRTLKQVKLYLENLCELRSKNELVKERDPDMAINFPEKAWEKVYGTYYISRKNGLGEPLPNFYLKIPTGGGKTLLACHTVDLVNRIYRRNQTGFVLWIVPTTQIYRQTLSALRNRDHPYRQVLDIASAGRTLILEKNNRFTPSDVAENLTIMLLMLPSANRLNKETLKAFKDSGAFVEFFPSEDDHKGNEKLLAKFPNLDYFGDKRNMFGRVVKTSLGNTLRTLNPAIIIDEGQKAYSKLAQNTINNFNPCILVELSATPPEHTNRLVDISGQELNREEMIKLDLHITNMPSLEWEDTIRTVLAKRAKLEEKAVEYKANSGEYIRPICLIQVERTGRDQRASRYIHSEDVKEFLINKCGVDPAEVAIKSSEKDDIEGINLLSEDCSIRFIITKHALQEGWDCAFAYVLAILTNPKAQLSITQLVGRILRQPKARKTKIKELDESYVYCFRQNAADLLNTIRKGFQQEGLGDLAGNISLDLGDPDLMAATKLKTLNYRDRFKKFEGKIYLPKFVIQADTGFRDLSYEMDLLSRIDWKLADISFIDNLDLNLRTLTEHEAAINLADDKQATIAVKDRYVKPVGMKINLVFLARQLIDIVPNPWIAFEIGKKVIIKLLERYPEERVAANFIFIIEELRKHLSSQKDEFAQNIFKMLLDEKKLCFFLVKGKGGFRLPRTLIMRSNTEPLVRQDFEPIQASLFERVPKDQFNELERSVALCLDSQAELLWWYRNRSRLDYYIQGWQKNKIFADFILAKKDQDNSDEYNKVYVLETKGAHLKNEDTTYKQNVFELCNELGNLTDWTELGLEFPDQRFLFQVVFGEEWESQLHTMFQ